MDANRVSSFSRFTLGFAILTGGLSAQASSLSVDVIPSQSVIHADHKQRVFVKIGLTGGAMQVHHRAAANIAIVLDKSGSMSGIKMIRAKQAAIMAVNRLSRSDVVSIIAYSGHVEVIQPATRAADKELVTESIRRIRASGSTALFAGVTRGASELRKYLQRNQINRVILLSDGQANVGPRTPYELGQLGSELSELGISVTTIGLGLGYNEDLMTKLASTSGGNHAFVENANDLARIFNQEFNDVLSVVASNASINIICQPGVRPIRVFGHKASISGQTINVKINQVYSKQQKYVIVELEVPANKHGSNVTLANIKTSYRDLKTKKRALNSQVLTLRYDHSIKRSKASLNNKVMSSAIEYIAIRKSQQAIKLRDAGKPRAARRAMQKNAQWLSHNAKRYKSKKLKDYAAEQNKASERIASPSWNRTRKELRKSDYSRSVQQSF
ncbi:hypothetical protein MNBD_GAMMA12-814 [hydrothermal vent metagenome]|uniref:VWFA domain-containing protein n=1 Tax=hydrothermal vent metagenome TaxID=652676 RepID=A0A3B0YMP4_9ZZZZ